ncbi:unnamed protein product [Closterium sp. NIES-54]
MPCAAGVGAAALGASESAAALGASASAATGASESATSEHAASAEALDTFTLDSGASRCFFCDCTTFTPLAAPDPVSLADPSRGPVVARASIVLPCPAVPSGSLSGLHLRSFLTNLVSNAVLQDVWVDTFTPGGQRVAICTTALNRTVLYSTAFNRIDSHSNVLDRTSQYPYALIVPTYPTMSTSRILTFDPEGHSIDFPRWLRKLKLYLGSRIENDVRVLKHATGKLVAPKDPGPLGASPSKMDEARFEKAQLAVSRWAARDDATVLAITDLLPLSEQHHFEQEVTAKGLFDAVVKWYSTPTTASLGRLVLPFLFPDLPSFPRVADLILHLRSLDAQLRSAAPDLALLTTNPPPPPRDVDDTVPPFHLLDRFATARDHFLAVNPMSLTIDLFEERLTTVEDLALSLAAASSTVLPPIFEGSQLLPLATKGARRAVRREEVVEVVGVVEGAAVEVVEGVVVEVVEGAVVGGAAGVVVAVAEGVGVVVEMEVEAVEEEVVGRPSTSSPSSSSNSSSSSSSSSSSHSSSDSSSSRANTSRPSSSSGGRLDQGAMSAAAAHPAGRRVDRFSTPPTSTGCRLGRAETTSVAAPTLQVSALRSLLTATAPGLAPPALPQTGPHWSALLDAVEVASAVPVRVACTGPTTQAASLSFTLDSGASSCFFLDQTDLTPLRTLVTVALGDPSVGAVVARSTTTLPCPAAPSGVLTGYYTPSLLLIPSHHGSLQDPALGRLEPLPGPWSTSGALLLDCGG